MPPKRISWGCRSSMIVTAAALLSIATPTHTQEAVSRQAQVLADLAARIVTCSVHPCPGDSEKDVRRFLKGKIVSDGTFYYSELGVAYPSVEHALQGLVEWDLDGGLDMVGLKLTDFHVAPSILIPEVEQVLPGCEMGQEPSDCVTEGADRDHEDDETQEWSCMAKVEGKDGILVEVYLVPGLVLVEIGS